VSYVSQAQALAAVAGVALLLGGCSSSTDEDVNGQPVAPAVEEVLPDPEFVPDWVEGGTALENQAFIDYVVRGVLDDPTSERAGLAVATALQEAGIPIEVLELTSDTSLIRLPVDSTTVAIRVDEECVIGQWGADWYVSQVEPLLVTERCLVGETVSLN